MVSWTKGLLTIDQIAERLGVHPSTIKRWHHAGFLTSHQANDKNQRLYQPPTPRRRCRTSPSAQENTTG